MQSLAILAHWWEFHFFNGTGIQKKKIPWLGIPRSVTSAHKSVCSLHTKFPLLLPDLKQYWHISTNFIKPPLLNFMEIRPIVHEFLRADGLTYQAIL
jgi:hypothetical protein